MKAIHLALAALLTLSFPAFAQREHEHGRPPAPPPPQRGPEPYHGHGNPRPPEEHRDYRDHPGHPNASARNTAGGFAAVVQAGSGSTTFTGPSHPGKLTMSAAGSGMRMTSSSTKIPIILGGIWPITPGSGPMCTCSIWALSESE